MITLDVPYVFEIAGGPRGLLDLLDRYEPGHNLPYATVQMWKQRNVIPGRMIPVVLYAMHRAGYDFIWQFFIDDAWLHNCRTTAQPSPTKSVA